MTPGDDSPEANHKTQRPGFLSRLGQLSFCILTCAILAAGIDAFEPYYTALFDSKASRHSQDRAMDQVENEHMADVKYRLLRGGAFGAALGTVVGIYMVVRRK